MNRHFNDRKAAFDRPIGQLDLKRISFASHGIKIDRAQHRRAEALIAARQIADRQAEDRAAIERAALAQKVSSRAPARHAATRNIPGADDDIGAAFECPQKRREMRRIVGKVGVHLEDNVVAFGETPLKTLHIGRSDAALAGAVHDLDPWIVRGEPIGDITRAIRGCIVDHKHMRLGDPAKHGLHEVLEVLAFVVGGRDDENARALHGFGRKVAHDSTRSSWRAVQNSLAIQFGALHLARMDGTVICVEPSTFIQEHCAVCQGKDHRPRFGEVLPWVVVCTKCGLVFANPQPSDKELSAIYDEHYYEQFGFIEGPNASDLALARMKRATYNSILDIAQPAMLPGGKRLLDIGCGLGFSLFAAMERGFDALGIDPLAPGNPELRPGRRVLQGTLETFQPDAPFDLVSMVDVIEHVRDPVGTIRRLVRLLAPGGVVALATNDSSSLGARLLGPRWTHYHRAHLWFFTPDTLRDVAVSAGLEVVRTAPIPRTYNLDYIASILARGTNFELAAKMARLALRVAPKALLDASWPPVKEGFVLVARKAGR